MPNNIRQYMTILKYKSECSLQFTSWTSLSWNSHLNNIEQQGELGQAQVKLELETLLHLIYGLLQKMD